MTVRKSDWGLPVGTTHIIVEAGLANHGDAPTTKFQDEKGQGIECHGWGRGGVFTL
jgi:hypothetical protein